MGDYYGSHVPISELNGKVIKSISGLESGSDEVFISTECGQDYKFYHAQDCCECVNLCDFDGDEGDLIGGLIISAEEVEGVLSGKMKFLASSQKAGLGHFTR